MKKKVSVSVRGAVPIAIILLLLVLAAGTGVGVYSRRSSKTAEKELLLPPEQPIQEETFPEKELTPQEQTSESQVSQEQAPQKRKVKLFFIALDDQGQGGKLVGCGDSVMGVEQTVVATDTDLIKVTLEVLFAVKSETYGKEFFHNALAKSDLKVEKVSLENGQANVYLSGTYSLAGTCDAPRFQAQVEETILQFPSVKKTNVFLNGKTLGKLFSGNP